jgi:hypothetical protein
MCTGCPANWPRARIQPRVTPGRGSGADLTDAEREQTDQAVAIVRRHRTVTLGMPRMRQALPDIRPGRTA